MPTVEELLAAAPTVTGGGGGKKQPGFIGFPDDYTPPSREVRVEGKGWATAPGSPPRYMDGDEIMPASYAPERIAQLQAQMVKVGLIPPRGKYRPGYWDDTSRNAFKDLLAFSNYRNVDYNEALAQMAADPATGAMFGEGDGRERAPLTVRVSSPDEIAQVIRATARDVIGRKLSDEETQRIVSAYQQQETAFQQQAYNMDDTGGTVVEPPSAQTVAEQQIRTTAPVEARGQEMAGVFDSFLEIVGKAGA